MHCPKCQFEVVQGVSHCIRCGYDLGKPALGQTRDAKEPQASAPAQPKRVYVLIVEDDEACARIISDYLENNGIPWRTTCSDASQAVIQAQALHVGIVLMDIMLPRHGSGVDAYKMFRQSPRLPKELPIIFYTGMNPQKATSMMPFHDPNIRLLFKPLDLGIVLQTIRELAKAF